MKPKSAFALGGLCGIILSTLIMYLLFRSVFLLGPDDLVNAGRAFRALKSLRSDDSGTAIVELEDSINWTVTKIRVFRAHEGSPRDTAVIKFLRDVARYREEYPYEGGSTEEFSQVEDFLSDFR